MNKYPQILTHVNIYPEISTTMQQLSTNIKQLSTNIQHIQRHPPNLSKSHIRSNAWNIKICTWWVHSWPYGFKSMSVHDNTMILLWVFHELMLVKASRQAGARAKKVNYRGNNKHYPRDIQKLARASLRPLCSTRRQYLQIARNIIKYQQISTNINNYDQISTNINKHQEISTNINK